MGRRALPALHTAPAPRPATNNMTMTSPAAQAEAERAAFLDNIASKKLKRSGGASDDQPGGALRSLTAAQVFALCQVAGVHGEPPRRPQAPHISQAGAQAAQQSLHLHAPAAS